jgi:hypothetical protein
MSTNYLPAQRISEDAKLTLRGTAFAARGDISDKVIRGYVEVPLSSGRKRKVISDVGYQFTIPVLCTFASLLPLFTSWQKIRYGQAVAPRPIPITEVNTDNNFTAVAHGLSTSDTVQIYRDCAFPACTPALSVSEVYTVTATDADTFTLTTTTGSPTLVDITSATLNGGLWVVKQDTLIVNQRDSTQRTFLNVVPVELPDLVFNGSALQWEGNLVIRCFPKLGATAAGGTANFFTSTNAAFTAATWAGTEDITISDMTAAWASGRTSTLETSFRCEKGMRVSFKPELSMIDDGIFSSASAFLKDFKVSAKGIPLGLLTSEFLAEFAPNQGAQLTGANLVLTATGVALTLYDAQLSEGSQSFGTDKPLVDELTWEAMGNSTSDNKPPFLLAAS